MSSGKERIEGIFNALTIDEAISENQLNVEQANYCALNKFQKQELLNILRSYVLEEDADDYLASTSIIEAQKKDIEIPKCFSVPCLNVITFLLLVHNIEGVTSVKPSPSKILLDYASQTTLLLDTITEHYDILKFRTSVCVVFATFNSISKALNVLLNIGGPMIRACRFGLCAEILPQCLAHLIQVSAHPCFPEYSLPILRTLKNCSNGENHNEINKIVRAIEGTASMILNLRTEMSVDLAIKTPKIFDDKQVMKFPLTKLKL